MTILKRSPHYGQHVAHGAKSFFDFAGWEMPEFFSSIEDEVHACRSAAVLFDGHQMGEVYITGKDALKAVQRLCVNDFSRVVPGKCVYTSLCNEKGGIVDDLVVLCLAPDKFLLTVAAFNVAKTPGWIGRHVADLDVQILDQSSGTTIIEVQGPRSRDILERVADFDVSNEGLPYYSFVEGKVAGIECIVARLGVTGELGYEIIYDPGYAYSMHDALVEAGRDSDMALCGSRTVGVFRLEKVYHVYNREIDETTNPFEAGLDRVVKLGKGDFIGREALSRIKKQGVSRKLVGYTVAGGAVSVAPGTPIEVDGETIGKVTVAGPSPTLSKTIGLGYVATEFADIGTNLVIRGDSGPLSAQIVEKPFFDPEGTRIRI